MNSEQPGDKVFAHAQYTVHYRRMRRARWASEAGPHYAALLLLGGALRWQVRSSVTDEGSATPAEDPALDRGEVSGEGALLVNPGDVAQAGGASAEFVALSLAPAFVLDCAVRARLTRVDARIAFRARVVERDEHLARLARALSDELLAEMTGQEVVVAAIIEQLLVHLLRRHANIRRSDELELSRAGLIDRRIRRAVELMDAHLERDLQLEEIAAAAHLSPFHFSRLFKKLTGATPHAYLAALRAARARTLLSETDLAITEIGSRVGYGSPSHFAKAFRQSSGLSPSAFRRALVRRR